jgi:hypothetical protein
LPLLYTTDPLWVLLLDIRLRTTLLRLTNVVPLLSSNLGIAIAGDSSNGALGRASNSVGNTTSEVVDLALSFLSFARGVLLLAFLFQ